MTPDEYADAHARELTTAKRLRDDAQLREWWSETSLPLGKIDQVAAIVASIHIHLIDLSDERRNEISDEFLDAIESFQAAVLRYEANIQAQLPSLNDVLYGAVDAPEHGPADQGRRQPFDVRYIKRIRVLEYLDRLHAAVNEGAYMSRNPHPLGHANGPDRVDAPVQGHSSSWCVRSIWSGCLVSTTDLEHAQWRDRCQYPPNWGGADSGFVMSIKTPLVTIRSFRDDRRLSSSGSDLR